MSSIASPGIESVPPWNKTKKSLNVVVETPKGSRNKYNFDGVLKVFKLGAALPLGHSFPFDFGYIPQTKGGDGDPMDVLVLMDEPVFTGCLVECRLIGGLEAYQTEPGKRPQRNDRLLAVAEKSVAYAQVKSINDLDPLLLKQIEHFFVSYNQIKSRRFKVEKIIDARTATKTVANSIVKGDTENEGDS